MTIDGKWKWTHPDGTLRDEPFVDNHQAPRENEIMVSLVAHGCDYAIDLLIPKAALLLPPAVLIKRYFEPMITRLANMVGPKLNADNY